MNIKNVAVYCGHQPGKNPNFLKAASEMGALLAKHGINLVWGGGDVGLMGAVASGVIDNGGVATGISTHHVIALQEPAHKGARVEIVSGINERKQKMYEMSDAFIILPGGLGTLNELTDVMTMHQIGESEKPIFFLNTDEYWDIFERVMKHMYKNGFIPDLDCYHMTVCETPEELIEKLIK